MELEKITQKMRLTLGKFSMRFFVVGTVLTLVFFFFLFNIFKTYSSSETILVLAKSQVAAQQQDLIVGNIAKFPKTLAFFDTLLKNNPDVRDFTVGNGPEKRKDLWNNILSVKKDSGNSVISITITAKRQMDADLLVKKTTRTLLDFSANYYDIKNDLDMRIIDGPISHSQTSRWPWLFLLSIVLGFGIAVIVQYLFVGAKKTLLDKNNAFRGKSWFDFNKEKTNQADVSALDEFYNIENVEPTYHVNEEIQIPEVVEEDRATPEVMVELPVLAPQIQEMKKLTKMVEGSKYPNFPEMPLPVKPQASAPDNLPIGDGIFFPQQSALVDQSVTKQEEALEEVEQAQGVVNEPRREPTDEELRKRLNQLLKGDL